MSEIAAMTRQHLGLNAAFVAAPATATATATARTARSPGFLPPL